jgi:hypothetical protein
VLDPHAAAGGVAFTRGAALVAEWQLGKVLRVALDGTTTTFLDGLVHPLPVVATADGDVLVGDWGTGKIHRVATA